MGLMTIISLLLAWLSKQSIARLFGYTRQLERELVQCHNQIKERELQLLSLLDDERDKHQKELERERDLYELQRQEWKEREQILLDRLFPHYGYATITTSNQQQATPTQRQEPFKTPRQKAIEQAQAQEMVNHYGRKLVVSKSNDDLQEREQLTQAAKEFKGSNG